TLNQFVKNANHIFTITKHLEKRICTVIVYHSKKTERSYYMRFDEISTWVVYLEKIQYKIMEGWVFSKETYRDEYDNDCMVLIASNIEKNEIVRMEFADELDNFLEF